MRTILAKSGGGGVSPTRKAKVVKAKKSVLQLSKELIPDGKFAGLSKILEPYELREAI